MYLKSLTLNNIRSYEHQTISFPAGSVLLSGDIGAGKSTILLAIEFALFGVRRKHLSGSSLLRHGRTKGDVALTFELDGKEVLVKRVLKRGKDDVKQEAGYIIVDGMKKEGTHVELKSAILSLLGYPSDLLTKSKDLVFRYTVYTPQEAMKQILLDETESRLNTLRKVFNIDKYKRIREHAALYSGHLREKLKLFEGLLADLPEREKDLGNKKKQYAALEKELSGLLPRFATATALVKQHQERVVALEKKVKVVVELRKQLAVQDNSLQSVVEQHQRSGKEIVLLKQAIGALEKEVGGGAEDVSAVIVEKEKDLQSLAQRQLKLRERRSEAEVKRKQASETITKISSLDNCPLCLQQVAHEHKSTITNKEEKRVARAVAELDAVAREEDQLTVDVVRLQEEVTFLRRKQADVQAATLRRKNLEEKRARVASLEQDRSAFKERIGAINVSKRELQVKLDAQKDVDDAFGEAKWNLEQAREEEKGVAIQARELEVRKEECGKQLIALEQDLAKKKEAERQKVDVQEYQSWITGFFIDLMATMEKHVMLSVYHEFNSLFQEWFSLLLEDETLSVRLDDAFTPVIEQNGYESSLENLSGGEKTSIALAYRLALNRVITDVISGIRTKDFLILDEPTDGFSSEQLDRMRLVLHELQMKQVIIVSHETKIETFVDHVIRITKEDHVSSVSNGC